MSKKGQIWQAEIAERVTSHLAAELSAEELVDWAIDHPFFEEESDLEEAEKKAIAAALGFILQLDAAEPQVSRTTHTQLTDLIETLWQHADRPRKKSNPQDQESAS